MGSRAPKPDRAQVVSGPERASAGRMDQQGPAGREQGRPLVPASPWAEPSQRVTQGRGTFGYCPGQRVAEEGGSFCWQMGGSLQRWPVRGRREQRITAGEWSPPICGLSPASSLCPGASLPGPSQRLEQTKEHRAGSPGISLPVSRMRAASQQSSRCREPPRMQRGARFWPTCGTWGGLLVVEVS